MGQAIPLTNPPAARHRKQPQQLGELLGLQFHRNTTERLLPNCCQNQESTPKAKNDRSRKDYVLRLLLFSEGDGTRTRNHRIDSLVRSISNPHFRPHCSDTSICLMSRLLVLSAGWWHGGHVDVAWTKCAPKLPQAVTFPWFGLAVTNMRRQAAPLSPVNQIAPSKLGEGGRDVRSTPTAGRKEAATGFPQPDQQGLLSWLFFACPKATEAALSIFLLD